MTHALPTKGGMILTSQGAYFPFHDPDSHPFDIEEIAHALSHICRFTGHTSEFYSVAQHSVYVAELCAPHDKFEGLMHDTSEAYLGDVASPLKAMLPDYRALEHSVEHAIARQFGLPFPLSPSIKIADMRMLVTERRDLLPRGAPGVVWPQYPAADFRVLPLPPHRAKQLFLDKYEQYLYERIATS